MNGEQQALTAGAHALQQAAGKVLKHAGAAEDPETLSVALAHIEEALDRLSIGMLLAASAVTEGQPPTPAVEALSFHLRRAAERLREPELACQSSRFWTRRMIAPAPHAEAELTPSYSGAREPQT